MDDLGLKGVKKKEHGFTLTYLTAVCPKHGGKFWTPAAIRDRLLISVPIDLNGFPCVQSHLLGLAPNLSTKARGEPLGMQMCSVDGRS